MEVEKQPRDIVIKVLQEDMQRYISFKDRLSTAEQVRVVTPEGWSAKDILAHMTHWKGAALTSIEAHLQRRPLPPVTPSGDEANAVQRLRDEHYSLQEVHAMWVQAHTQLERLIQDIDDEHVYNDVYVPWAEDVAEPFSTLIYTMYEHDQEHFDQIEQYFPL